MYGCGGNIISPPKPYPTPYPTASPATIIENSTTNENAFKIISPKAGDTFRAGDTITIQWMGGAPESKLALTLYHSIPGVLNPPAVDQFQYQYGFFDINPANKLWDLPNTGTFNWKIPSTFAGTYTIGLSCNDGCPKYMPKDLRDNTGVITIDNTQSIPSISHISFRNNGDPVLYEGKTYTVDWVVINPPTQNNFKVAIIFGDSYQGKQYTYQIPFSPNVNSFQLTVPVGIGGDDMGNKKWIDICLQDSSSTNPVPQYVSCDRSVTVYVKK